MKSKILAGRTVVITRPAHQAERLARQIQEWGGKIIIFPLLEILPVDDDGSLPAVMENLPAYQIAIFVSANAVHYAMPFCRGPFTIHSIAIGPGTARALQTYHVRERGCPNLITAKEYWRYPFSKISTA